MVRRTAAVAAALLGLFHAWLFLGQLWDGRALQPGIALRWALAAALVGGLLALRRRGQSMFGRRAAVVWLLAALLHGPRALDGLQGLQPDVWTEVATVATTLAATAALAAGVAAALTGRARARGVPALTPSSAWIRAFTPSDALAHAPFAPRPPPAAIRRASFRG
jgi:hypothetical protein